MAKGTVESGALKVIKITANMSQHAWGVYCGPELSGSPYMDELTNPSHQPGERETKLFIIPYFTGEEIESQRDKELARGHPDGRLQNQLSNPELRGPRTFS